MGTFAPSTKARPDAVRKNAAAERREARRSASWAGDLRAFSEIDPTARRVRGAALPHQRLSALCSPHFFRGAENGQGAPGAPLQTGRRSVGCLKIEDGGIVARMERSEIRVKPNRVTEVPHCAEFIIGRAFGAARWLHAG